MSPWPFWLQLLITDLELIVLTPSPMDQPIEKTYYAIGIIVNHTCSWLNYGGFEVIIAANRYVHVSHIPHPQIQQQQLQ